MSYKTLKKLAKAAEYDATDVIYDSWNSNQITYEEYVDLNNINELNTELEAL